MATTLTNITGASFNVNIAANAVKALDLSTPSDPMKAAKSRPFTFGTGADTVDMIWHDERTLAASTSEDLDLAGVLKDAFGDTVTFAKVRAMLVVNISGNTADIDIGGAAATQFLGPFIAAANEINLPDGDFFACSAHGAAGWTVTAAAVDLLKIENNHASLAAKYQIVLLGEAA